MANPKMMPAIAATLTVPTRAEIAASVVVSTREFPRNVFARVLLQRPTDLGMLALGAENINDT